MPMEPGKFECPGEDTEDIECTADGMTATIYEALKGQFADDVAELEPKHLRAMHKAWCRLALAVATGVITHIKSHMVIKEIKTHGEVSISGKTGAVAEPPGPGDPGHLHIIDLTVPEAGVTFTQIPGTGSVE